MKINLLTVLVLAYAASYNYNSLKNTNYEWHVYTKAAWPVTESSVCEYWLNQDLDTRTKIIS